MFRSWYLFHSQNQKLHIHVFLCARRTGLGAIQDYREQLQVCGSMTSILVSEIDECVNLVKNH